MHAKKGEKLTKITPKLQNTKKSKTLDGFFTFLAQSSPIYIYFQEKVPLPMVHENFLDSFKDHREPFTRSKQFKSKF